METVRDFWERLREGLQLTKKEVAILVILGGLAGTFFFLWIHLNRNEDATGDFLFTIATQFGWAVIGFIVLEVVMVRVRELEGANKVGFEYKKFVENVGRSSKTVRIFTTFTYLLTPEGSDVDRKYKSQFFTNLEHLAQKDANPKPTIQLLFLDPYSYAAYQREPEKGKNTHKYIKNNLIEIYKWKQDIPAAIGDQVDVRVFDALPPFALLQTDRRMWMIFFKREVAIKDSPRFECYEGSQLANYVEVTFNDIWNKSSRPLDNYMRLPVTVTSSAGSVTEMVYFVKDERSFLRREYIGNKNFYLLLNQVTDEKILEALAQPNARVGIKWREKDCECLNVREIGIGSSEDKSVQLRAEKYGGKFEFHTIFQVEIENKIS